MMSLGMRFLPFAQDAAQVGAKFRGVLLRVAGIDVALRRQIGAMRAKLEAERGEPFLRWRHAENLLARVQDRVHEHLVFLEQLGVAVDGQLVVVEGGRVERRVRELGIVEAESQRLPPQLIGVAAAFGPAVLGDLPMSVDQGDYGGHGHHHRRDRHGVVPEPHGLAPYSAATGTDGAIGSSARASMRSSITWRKCRIKPWMGQAAASPSAQMVWPST